MPEPNLPPLRVLLNDQPAVPNTYRDHINVQCLRRKLPELPSETRAKLTNKYGISPESAAILVNENVLLQHFYDIMEEKKSRDPKLSTNILIMELLTILNKKKLSLEASPFPSHTLGEIVDLLQSEKINLVTARKILQEIISGNSMSPSEVVEKYEWTQITNPSEIEKVCTAVIEQNPKLVEQFCSGKTKVFNSLVGKAAKITENRANMATVVQVLTAKLRKIQNP
ncbi:hypothetical protein B7P43_G12691 [Cryptotermes secundus]|nr:hypothetical protein B7P43_G12691 [Cryptotermes secundus]